MIFHDKEGKELFLYYPKSSRRLVDKDKINFISDSKHMVQIGIWNEYSKNHKLIAHTHLSVERSTVGTHEMFYVESGKIRVYIYDDNLKPFLKLDMLPGDILVQLSGGHTFDVLEEGTTVIEVKNGPFMGRSADKMPIEVKKW